MSNRPQNLLLKGRTFLITRTIEGNKHERADLEKLGAKVIELPLIEIKPSSNPKMLDRALQRISEFDWIVFTSANGVNLFFDLVNKKRKKAKIRAKFACVGIKTKDALEDNGFKASLVPRTFLTEELGKELSSSFDLNGKKILLARAEEANKKITSILKKGGAIVTEAPVYRTVTIKKSPKSVLDRVTDITLTSPSTVKALLANFKKQEIRSRNIHVHCIGPVTAKSAEQGGLVVSSIASVHTVDGIVNSLLEKEHLVPYMHGKI